MVRVKEIREKARALGIKNIHRMRKTELIHTIQVQEGNAPCYREITDCRQYDCCWMADCQGRG
ncbi:MAG: Rho termination factor N-terminal domain-containing protein [Deltaproteobacteria bacterium]|nr:Rho termination factor N-terminal domain-containing protein [Deltaproteobacteria bacterium]